MAGPRDVEPEDLAREAERQGARVVVSTYNEPLITAEWGVAVFKAARARGLASAFVSNGNGTPQVLDYIVPWLDLYKVDLKSFDDKQYRKLGGRLEPILETIRALYARQVWLEIVTLLVPGFNDSREEIAKLTEFLASVSVDIPWHVTAFHQDYKMTSQPDTTATQLRSAASIGRAAGCATSTAATCPAASGSSRTPAARRARPASSPGAATGSATTPSRPTGNVRPAMRLSLVGGTRRLPASSLPGR